MRPGADFDVAVAGGGVVGGTLAALLGGFGLEVALIEAGEPPLARRTPKMRGSWR